MMTDNEKKMHRERFAKIVEVCDMAEALYGKEACNKFGDRISRMMDLQSADKEFNLRLDEMLKLSMTYDFAHDIFGIWTESNRETYPATFGLFVPRFSGRKM